ncbi:MAG TPA: hypothetical protein VFR55_09120 [Dehalococcoidia bacterium]|nr:hypothetical protein [Dehalococcoidia bacterium]
MTQPEDRPIAEDLACPVLVEPGMDFAVPADLNWRLVGTSLPNRATFHVSHTDVTQVKVGVLRPEDMPREALFVLIKDIPIIVIDSVDKFWAGESRRALPLNGLRVPIEGDTEAEARQNLAGDLAAQFRLLLLLSTTRRGQLAPQLVENLRLYQTVIAPAR